MSRRELTAPFPWFGGKSAIADVVWKRLGNVTNYVEPFFGSGAVLLARPQIGKTETINDKDHFVANDGEHDMPSDWEVVEWKARGGFGSQDDDEDGTGRVNSQRERLWFSPACIKPHQDKSLLDLLEAAE